VNELIGTLGVLGVLLVAGGLIGVADRGRFAPAWLIAAAALVVLNDALLTGLYGLLPDLLPDARWNWQGKVLALAATLAVAALPALGWRRVGLTFTQAPGSLRAAVPVLLAYCGFFLAIALAFPDDAGDAETIAFQLTMPGLEEEPFYRGVLLIALMHAYPGRLRLLGVDWSWGAVLPCALFGLAHAFGYGADGFSFDPITMALTALPALIGVWLRLRTGSLLLPILLHNFGNAITLLI